MEKMTDPSIPQSLYPELPRPKQFKKYRKNEMSFTEFKPQFIFMSSQFEMMHRKDTSFQQLYLQKLEDEHQQRSAAQ